MRLVAAITIALIIFISGCTQSSDQQDQTLECIPEQCCHPTSCVLASVGPECSGAFCTEECRPGTMDCGCGYCEFNSTTSECEVVWTRNSTVC